jgi:hypothetical protein
MGKRRRDQALGASLEERIAARKAQPKGVFKNGSSLQKTREKQIQKNQKNQGRRRIFDSRGVSVF